MSLKQRIERLEQASLQDDDLSKMVLWRCLVTRNGNMLTEAVHSTHILAGPHGSAETHERRPGEGQGTFVRHVLDRAAIIWDRHDEVFAEGIRCLPKPGTGSRSGASHLPLSRTIQAPSEHEVPVAESATHALEEDGHLRLGIPVDVHLHEEP